MKAVTASQPGGTVSARHLDGAELRWVHAVVRQGCVSEAGQGRRSAEVLRSSFRDEKPSARLEGRVSPRSVKA